jgi:hypothetical protein
MRYKSEFNLVLIYGGLPRELPSVYFLIYKILSIMRYMISFYLIIIIITFLGAGCGSEMFTPENDPKGYLELHYEVLDSNRRVIVAESKRISKETEYFDAVNTVLSDYSSAIVAIYMDTVYYEPYYGDYVIRKDNIHKIHRGYVSN